MEQVFINHIYKQICIKIVMPNIDFLHIRDKDKSQQVDTIRASVLYFIMSNRSLVQCVTIMVPDKAEFVSNLTQTICESPVLT